MKTEIFEQKGVELVDNTPDEIKDLAIEMVENFECKKKYNPEDEELQEIFTYMMICYKEAPAFHFRRKSN